MHSCIKSRRECQPEPTNNAGTSCTSCSSVLVSFVLQGSSSGLKQTFKHPYVTKSILISGSREVGSNRKDENKFQRNRLDSIGVEAFFLMYLVFCFGSAFADTPLNHGKNLDCCCCCCCCCFLCCCRRRRLNIVCKCEQCSFPPATKPSHPSLLNCLLPPSHTTSPPPPPPCPTQRAASNLPKAMA